MFAIHVLTRINEQYRRQPAVTVALLHRSRMLFEQADRRLIGAVAADALDPAAEKSSRCPTESAPFRAATHP